MFGQILEALKVDTSLFYQLFVVCVLYGVLSRWVFGPYYEAFLKRQDKTVGGEDRVAGLEREREELYKEYKTQARKLSAQNTEYFHKLQLEAQAECAKSLEVARTNARHYLKTGRERMREQSAQARALLSKEAPALRDQVLGRLKPFKSEAMH